MTKLLWLFAFAVVTLGGCATYKPVPDGYTGPTAVISDSIQRESGGKGQVFIVSQINGNDIANAASVSRAASQGRGFSLLLAHEVRFVKPEMMKLTLVATHITAAPIHEFASRAAGEFFSVRGEVDFQPVAGRSYVVTGVLSKNEKAVWIEDRDTKEVVTRKITSN